LFHFCLEIFNKIIFSGGLKEEEEEGDEEEEEEGDEGEEEEEEEIAERTRNYFKRNINCNRENS